MIFEKQGPLGLTFGSDNPSGWAHSRLHTPTVLLAGLRVLTPTAVCLQSAAGVHLEGWQDGAGGAAAGTYSQRHGTTTVVTASSLLESDC